LGVVYVTSLENRMGKTAVCAALGRHLLDDGKKVGFFKPVVIGSGTAQGADTDVAFMKRVLALDDPAESLCPVFRDVGRIKEAFTKISGNKDVVVVEGVDGQSPASYEIVKALDARVIIVDAYSPGIPEEQLLTACKFFGEYLLGVVINKVPASQLERVRGEASSSLGNTGVNILGVVPEDRALFTLTVGEIAGHIQGEILNNAEKSSELVEGIMLGALCVDPGPIYFGRKANKVAVLRDERPDMQMAALETSTRALVISGSTAPIPSVLTRAQAKGVPIITTGEDVVAIATSIEEALGTTRFNQENKLPRLAEIMEQNFNFGAVYQGLEPKS